jgi:hypothetical protein
MEVGVCVLPGSRALEEMDPDEPDGRRVGVIPEQQAGRCSPGWSIQIVDLDDRGRAARELDHTRVRGNHGKVTVDLALGSKAFAQAVWRKCRGWVQRNGVLWHLCIGD